MKKKDLEFFKNLLTNWLEDLLKQADRTVLGLRDSDDHSADPLDQAAFESGRNYMLRLRDRESMLIKKIRKSLQDIEDG
ncbi:MAG: RNA polymerase-binding protein DksA, partial [Desulfobacterales bacterium]